MKKVILLGSKDSAGKNDIRAMRQKLAEHIDNESLLCIYFEDLILDISSEKQQIIDVTSGLDLANADLILAFNWYKGGPKSLYRDVGFALALYLKKHNIAFWNSEMLQQRSISKVSAMMQLALMGMPVPHTYFSLQADNLFTDIKDNQQFVLKSSIASKGEDNFLCNSVKEAKNKLPSPKTPNHFIVQEFITNKSDYRVICFGGVPSMVIKRSRVDTSTHLNNVSQGAQASQVPLSQLPSKIVGECKLICDRLGREMAGIDILPYGDSLDRYVYLEVNAIPQLTSGTFVDDKMAILSRSINTTIKDIAI